MLEWGGFMTGRCVDWAHACYGVDRFFVKLERLKDTQKKVTCRLKKITKNYVD